jgi:hypothetical protein
MAKDDNGETTNFRNIPGNGLIARSELAAWAGF